MLDTQYEKFPSHPTSNVRNISVISSVSCMESSPLPVDEPVIESVEVVSADDAEEIRTCLPRRRGVKFDPPSNLNSYIPVASFPSRLIIAKGVA